MTTVDEILTAVSQLPPPAREELMRRLTPPSEAWDVGAVDADGNDAWDLQMVADAKGGKFDRLIADAKRDAAAGRTRDLP